MLEMHIFHAIDIPEVSTVKYSLKSVFYKWEPLLKAGLTSTESLPSPERLELNPISDSRGFGFVRFHDKRDASDAIKGMIHK